MNCSPKQIHKALEEKYFVKVYMPILRQVIQRFRPKLQDQTNDARMSFTSWVESYNSKIKRLIFNSNMTILELAEKLTACVLEEDKKQTPKAALVVMADTILPNVCNMLHKYLTVKVLRIQEDQVKQSLQYHAMIITQDELQRYLTI
ncbi:17432_t:CDS:2, partial [Gigaspora margarita]